MEIGQIITGHVNELLGLNKDISEERIKICKQCPLMYYSSTLGWICNRNLYVNPDTNDVSLTKKDNYYRGCGCRIKAKTTLNNATCPAHKW